MMKMTLRRAAAVTMRWLGSCLAALALSIGAGPAEATGPAVGQTDAQRILPISLPPAPAFDGRPLGLEDCRGSLDYAPDVVLAFCRNPGQDRRGDQGLRLVMLRLAKGGAHLHYSAPEGAGDAYSARPTVFDLAPTIRGRLVFVDHAAEFHYGTQVFFIATAGTPRMVGRIDWVTLDEDGQPASPTPHAALTVEAGRVLINFDRKLFKPRADGSAGPERSVRFSFEPHKYRWRRL